MKTKHTSKVLQLPTDEFEFTNNNHKRIKLMNTNQPNKVFNVEEAQKTSTAGYLLNSIKSLFSEDKVENKTKINRPNVVDRSKQPSLSKKVETPLLLDLSDPSQIICFIKSRSNKGIPIDASTMAKVVPKIESIFELNRQYERTIKSLEKEQISRSKMRLKTIQHPSSRKTIYDKTMLFNGVLREQMNLETKQEPTLTKADLEQLQSKITMDIERETQNITDDINKVKDKLSVLLENNLKNNFEEIKSPKKQPLKGSYELPTHAPKKQDFSYETEPVEQHKSISLYEQPEEMETKKVKPTFNLEKKVTFIEPEQQKKEVKNMFSFAKPTESNETDQIIKEDNKEIKNMFSFAKPIEHNETDKIMKEDNKGIKNMFSFAKPTEINETDKIVKEDNKEVKNMFSFAKPIEHNETDTIMKEDNKEIKNMFSFGNTKPTTPTFSFGPDKTSFKAPIFSYGPAKSEEPETKKSFKLFNNTSSALTNPPVFNFNSTQTENTSQTPKFNFGAPLGNHSNQNAPVFNTSQITQTSQADIFSGGQHGFSQNVDLFKNPQSDEGNNTFSLGQLNSSDSVNKRRIYKARRN